MTPLELLALICVFAVVRVAISLRPVPVGVVGEFRVAEPPLLGQRDPQLDPVQQGRPLLR